MTGMGGLSALPPEGAPEPVGGSDDVARTRRIDALAAYFRRHGAKYAPEALRRSALAAGYDQRDIDAAWAVTGEPAPVQGAGTATPAIVAIAYVVGTYALTFAVGAIPETSGLAIIVLAAALVVGVAAWLGLRGSRPRIADAFRIGVVIAIVVPLAIGVVALGVCLVVTTGFGAGSA